MSEEPKLDREELEIEEAELLPSREAMSIITPGFDRPVPIDQTDVLPPTVE
jgi:hypothetical protein